MQDEERLLKEGRAALAGARWKDARAVFDEALRSSDAAELHDGQATALWWLMAPAARHLAEEGRCRARALLAVTEGRFEGDSSRAAARRPADGGGGRHCLRRSDGRTSSAP